MNVIIKTGFETITHSIEFQPQTIEKGRLLVMAGHVRDVNEHRKSGYSYLIEAKVIRQTSVTLAPYETSVNINKERFVNKVNCTCVYNQSGKCKHVAALIYFVNNEECISKTSLEQQWGKPSARQFAKEKYSKGKYFSEMFPKKTQGNITIVNNTVLPVDLEELIGESTLKLVKVAELKISRKSEILEDKKLLPETIFDLNSEKNDCVECIKTFFIFNEEFITYKREYILDTHVEAFYLNNIVMNNEAILKLCIQTLDQSQCNEWYEARRLRLSASSNIHRILVRCRKSVDSLVNDFLNPKKIFCRATQYGLNKENLAREKYATLSGCLVKKAGVIICRSQPWLCASVDGIVIEDGWRIARLLEIKCPITCRTKPIIDYENKTCNVKYLHFVDDQVELKKNHPYYTQIQIQIYITGMFECDLFVYSPLNNGCCTVSVHRDEDFLKKAVLANENFYFNHYLPATYLLNI